MTTTEQIITTHTLDEQQVFCPRCGGNRMMAYQLEGTHAAYFESENWSADAYDDDETVVKVWCYDCKHVLLDRQQEVWGALKLVLEDEPRQQQLAEELERWAESAGIDSQNSDAVQEAIHDHYSAMASGTLNSGEVMLALLDIYTSPEAVKEFLKENTGEKD